MNNKGGSSKVSKQKHDLWNRIITTRKNICQQLMIYDSKITKRTMFCLARGPEHPKYELVLYDICSSLWWISKLMYNSDGEMKKLSAQQYNQRIFDGYAENADEVLLILERLPDCEASLTVASDIFRKNANHSTFVVLYDCQYLRTGLHFICFHDGFCNSSCRSDGSFPADAQYAADSCGCFLARNAMGVCLLLRSGPEQ